MFIAVNDEVFQNRVTAVNLIGRLAMHNPAYVMPSLRKALIQLMTELEYSTVTYAMEFLCIGVFTLLTVSRAAGIAKSARVFSPSL